MSEPLVSVYLPTHNRVELLRRAVESVRTQTYKNLELIVVDDASSDATPAYLSQVAAADPRLRVLRNATNLGQARSCNHAIAIARGSYVTGLDDDDYFLPHRIAEFVRHAGELDDYVFLSARICRHRGDGLPRQSRASRLSRSTYDFNFLLSKNMVRNQVFTRTERLRENRFDEAIKVFLDVEMWLRLLRKPGSKCRVLNTYSYVFDITHGYERKSDAQLNKVLAAIQLITDRYQLNALQRHALRSYLSGYGGYSSIVDAAACFVLNPSLVTLRKAFKVARRMHYWLPASGKRKWKQRETK